MKRVALVLPLLAAAFSSACVSRSPASVYRRVHRSVVSIEADVMVAPAAYSGSPSEARSRGAGFIWNPSSQILTASHVVAGARSVAVRFFDGQRVEARVVYSSPGADIAVLVVQRAPWSKPMPLKLGRLEDSEIGEPIYVIGNPLGIEHSLSTGVLAGRHVRGHVPALDMRTELVQTDAPITSGNSGGPMLGADGSVLGIASFVLTDQAGLVGLGFGVSVDTIREVLGNVGCADLGFDAVELPPEGAERLGVPEGRVRLVQNVYAKTPASRAGLVGGVFRTLIGERTVLLGGDVILETAPSREPDTGELTVWREGNSRTLRFQCSREDLLDTTPLAVRRSTRVGAAGSLRP